MGENIEDFNIRNYQAYWKEMEKLNKFTNIREIDNPKKATNKYNEFYRKAYKNSQEIMEIVLKKKGVNPLNEKHIKEFNQEFLKGVFNNAIDKNNDIKKNEEKVDLDAIRGYFFDLHYKMFILTQKYLMNEISEWEKIYVNELKEELTNQIRNQLITQVEEGVQKTLSNINLKNSSNKKSSQNQDKKETKEPLKLTQNFIDKFNNKLSNEIFRLELTDKASGQIIIENDNKELQSLKVNVVIEEEHGIKTVAEKIYEIFTSILDTKNSTSSSLSKKIAEQFCKENKEKIKEEFEKTLKAYNISILVLTLFYGFWGEAWTGIFFSSGLGNYFEKNSIISKQVGADKSFQKKANISSPSESIFLEQTPADVIIEIETNGEKKVYRIQSKQWGDSSLMNGAGEKNKKLGTREIVYFGGNSKNFNYFYDEETFNMIKFLIKWGYTRDEEEYLLENNPSMFKHLSLGSFNLDTFLEYAVEDVKGNDFFSLRGMIIPSVFLVKNFLDVLKEEIKNGIAKENMVTIDITSERGGKTDEMNRKQQKYKNSNLVFAGNPVTFKVKIKGLSINLKTFRGEI